MKENSIRNERSSMEETIKTIEKMIKSYKEADKCGLSNNDFKNEIKALEHILSDYKRVLKENEELKSKIENKDKYFELIIGLGYDYDGYYNRETSNGNIKGLADLMDELVQAARDGLNDMPYQK